MILSQYERTRLRAVLEQIKECRIPATMRVSATEFKFFFQTITNFIDDDPDEDVAISKLIGD